MAEASYYDRDADIAYLRLAAEGDSATVVERGWGLIDYDEQGRVCSIESRRSSEHPPYGGFLS
jgi:uncharacterized protein YuzE